MKILVILFALLSVFTSAQNSVVMYPVSDSTMNKMIVFPGRNSKQSIDKPYVIMVSLDGYRFDYSQKYGADIFLEFDVRAEQMIPSFPTKTFPNHYSIVTGMYPGRHGLISNTFYSREKKQIYKLGDRDKVQDGSWYYGEPLWVGAQRQNMMTASMFWVGSEAPIDGVLPNYYFEYDSRITNQERVNIVGNWLNLESEKRPHLITLYFELIDDLGHRYGPESEELKEGVREVNFLLKDLMKKVKDSGLSVNVIVVSDHGMLTIEQSQYIDLRPYKNKNSVFTTSFPLMIYSEDSLYIASTYEKLRKESKVSVYLKDSLPEHYHFELEERIGDIVFTPKKGYYPSWNYHVKNPGQHGFDYLDTPEMGSIFYATGPAFKKRLQIPAFENIHVYPLVAEILGISYDEDKIDGRKEVLVGILLESVE